jgi:hypothetical protein
VNGLDSSEVARALALDPDWAAELRSQWSRLIGIAVFGDLRSQRLGALPRLRKKALDCGEKVRSMLATRDWIPRPREQLKNALASALALEQSLADLEASAAELESGTDLEAYRAAISELATTAREQLRARSNEWASLLDRCS